MARSLVVFHLGERRFALRLGIVDRVLPMLEIVPLPRAPEVVLGVINVEGRVIPVVDIRARFALPHRVIEISDHLLIARTRRRTVALAVDAVEGVADTVEIVSTDQILEHAPHIEGVAKLNGDLIFIHDLDTFLSAAEVTALEAALESGAAP